MSPPSSQVLLELWERGTDADVYGRGQAVLAIACPELAEDQIDALTVDEWDRRLLDAHARWFGDTLECCTDCPACGGALELALPIAELTAQGNRQPPPAESLPHGWRDPRISDLVEAARHDDVSTASRVLARRCAGVSAAALADDELSAWVEGLPEFSIGADIVLSCALCAHSWRAPLDPLPFLWNAIALHAERLLHTVDRIARTYGWSERDILALTPERRRRYLEWIES